MTIEQFIRTLGYIAYVVLWLPILVILTPTLAIAMFVVFVRGGLTVKESIYLIGQSYMNGIKHDLNFIKTGIWY